MGRDYEHSFDGDTVTLDLHGEMRRVIRCAWDVKFHDSDDRAQHGEVRSCKIRVIGCSGLTRAEADEWLAERLHEVDQLCVDEARWQAEQTAVSRECDGGFSAFGRALLGG